MIACTLAAIPVEVDDIIVVDDASDDATVELISATADPRIQLVRRTQNGGVGAAIVEGYERFLAGDGEICVVMAGDAQMDPSDLPALVTPIAEGRADYTKGNRLFARDVTQVMPRNRWLGNIVFTAVTKWASGYWHVVDSQCGYTAIARSILGELDLDDVYPRYGVPNDLLIRLNVAGARVGDIPVRAIYGDEVSGIRPWTTIPRISFLLIRGFWWRMWHRYVLRDFHPLVLLYAFGFLLIALGLASGLWLVYMLVIADVRVSQPTAILVALFLIIGFQSALFAMTFDMMHNDDLKVRTTK